MYIQATFYLDNPVRMFLHKGVPRTHLYRMICLTTARTTGQAIERLCVGLARWPTRLQTSRSMPTTARDWPTPTTDIVPDTRVTGLTCGSRLSAERIQYHHVSLSR